MNIKHNFLTKIFSNSHFGNFVVLGLDRSVQLASQLFNIIFIAKYLHHSQFGVYMYAISLYGIILSITHFGLEKVLVVEYSHSANNSQRQNIFLNGVFIKLLSCLIAYLFLKFNLDFLSKFIAENTLHVLLKLSIATFFTSWMLVDTYNQYIGKFKNTVYARGISTILFLIIKIYIVWQDLGFDLLLYSFIGEQLLCLVLALFLSKNFILFVKQIDIKLFTINFKILRSGAVVLFSVIAILIYFKAAQGMVENELGYKFLGVYSLVISLIEIPIAISSIMSTILTPKLTILLKNNKNDTDTYSKILLLFLLIGIVCSVCILLAGLVVSRYLGSEYSGFYIMLLKSVISLPIIFVGYFFNMFLLCSKKFNQYFALTFLGAIFTVLFLFYMRGNVTINNAVYLYVFSQAIASLFVPILFQSSLRNIFFKSVNFFSKANGLKDWKSFFEKISKGNIVTV